MAWQGNILRVDLTAGSCVAEPLNMEWARKYLGQRGLGTKYLNEGMDPRADPLSPENMLIFATGPLTGTMASTGGRYSVITKGALTDAVACSNSGGFFGAELKFAGWDLLIVEGRAAEPVYLFIQDDEVEILSAAEYWGLSVWETEPAIKAKHHDPQIRVASIGRAGESGVRFASIMNDLDRTAGRSGVGAVMGSKNLKAIAVRGTQGVRIDTPEVFADIVAMARAKLDPHPGRKRLETYGTIPTMDIINHFGALPTRNSQDVQFEGIEAVNAQRMRTPRITDGRPNLQTNKACFACTIGCGRVSKIDPTHFSVAGKGKEQYLASQGGLEYESVFALAPLVGVADFEAATFANFVCNEQGMDTISFGGALAAAMELYEAGAVTDQDTGGVALNFGSAEALVAMVEQTGSGVGFGRDVGLGAKRLCEKYGRPEFAMVVKGQEFPGWDARAMQGMGLAYATSNHGANHMRAEPFDDDFAQGPIEGKAAIVVNTQHFVAAVDSTGLCMFTENAWGIGDYAMQVDAACAGDWSAERLLEVGERIWNLERCFNLDAGMTAADDTLPARILKDAAKSGMGKGKVSRLDEMLPEYYRLRGWSKDGVPTNSTIDRLDL